MRRPHLIQRCVLTPDKLSYDYMGMTEFEIGDQSKSLKRIFARDIWTGKLAVEVEGQQVEVFLLTSCGFSFDEYQEYMQILANEEYHRPEPTYFKEAICKQLGIKNEEFDYFNADINAWFDFQNDVLWVLTQEYQTQLIAVLKDIQKLWSQKNRR